MNFFFIWIVLVPGLVLAQEPQGKFDPYSLKENYEAKQRKIEAYVASKKAGENKAPLKAENIQIRIGSKDGSEGEYKIQGFVTFKVNGTTYNKKIDGEVNNLAQVVLSPGEKYYVTGFIRIEGEKAILITNIMRKIPDKAPESIGTTENKL